MRFFIVSFAGLVALAVASPLAQRDAGATESHLDTPNKFSCSPKETDQQCFAKLQEARANNSTLRLLEFLSYYTNNINRAVERKCLCAEFGVRGKGCEIPGQDPLSAASLFSLFLFGKVR
jgi:hypothetical protein